MYKWKLINKNQIKVCVNIVAINQTDISEQAVLKTVFEQNCNPVIKTLSMYVCNNLWKYER